MDEYIQHHGIKGMRWGVRKAYKSKQRGTKLVNKYGSKEAAAKAVNKKSKAKQIAKKSALALATAGAAYLSSQALDGLQVNRTKLSIANENLTEMLNDAQHFKNGIITGRYSRGQINVASNNIQRQQNNVSNSVAEVLVSSLSTGALGGAAVATKTSAKSRKDRRKLKDISNA